MKSYIHHGRMWIYPQFRQTPGPEKLDLGEEAYSVAWNEGAATTFQQAVEIALAS